MKEQAHLAGMKERRWGSIINVLNTAAKARPPASAPTSVSCSAGMALTKVLAVECGAHNILVDALLVGLIVSDQWVKRHAAAAPDIEFGYFTRNLAKGIPLGRRAQPKSLQIWHAITCIWDRYEVSQSREIIKYIQRFFLMARAYRGSFGVCDRTAGQMLPFGATYFPVLSQAASLKES
jgi:NAD(P)-dependent dehydrogenase (short-subunit alcohol dehydrogenase family)